LTTAAISNRQHKIQVNPKPKIQRTVSQSCKVQFFKRLLFADLENKFNYADENNNDFGQNSQATYAASKANCQTKKLAAATKTKSKKTAAEK